MTGRSRLSRSRWPSETTSAWRPTSRGRRAGCSARTASWPNTRRCATSQTSNRRIPTRARTTFTRRFWVRRLRVSPPLIRNPGSSRPVRTAMILPLLLALQAQVLVYIQDLSPQEHRSAAFALSAPQEIRITAIGAEPWPDQYRTRDERDWQDDEQTTWPAAAWILDAQTRAVVWDLRSAATERSSNGLRRFSGTGKLPAGVYEGHFAVYSASRFSFGHMSGQNFKLRELVRLRRPG